MTAAEPADLALHPALLVRPLDPRPAVERVEAVAAAPSKPERLYASSFGEVYVSDNDGATWSSYSAGLPDFADFEGIIVDPNNHDVVYMRSYFDGIYKSVDGGQTWQAKNEGLNDTRVNDMAMHVNDPQTLFIATTDAGLLKSIDGAETWRPSGGGIAGARVASVDVVPGRPDILFASAEGIIYRSPFAGVAWFEFNEGLDEPRTASDFQYDDTSDVIYAGTGNGVIARGSATQFGDRYGQIFLPAAWR